MNKKIVFASHDPGGCNILIPIIDFLADQPGYDISLLFAGSAKVKVGQPKNQKVTAIGIDAIPFEKFPNEFDVKQGDVIKKLDEIKPDVIITSTSINSNIERYAIQYGKSSGIPTVSYIDSWIGEDIRFKSDKVESYPDYILVCDSRMKMPYLKFESENCKVITVGNPHLESLAKEYQHGIGDENFEKDRVLFFCENIKHYYPEEDFNEVSILQAILNKYDYPRNLNIVVRPHPLESRVHWENFIENFSGFNKYLTITLDEIKDFRTSIKKSSLTFGISSMALIEASIMGKLTCSYQVGVENNRKFLYIPFDEYGIRTIHSIDEACKQLSLAGTQKSEFKYNPGQSVIDQIMSILAKL